MLVSSLCAPPSHFMARRTPPPSLLCEGPSVAAPCGRSVGLLALELDGDSEFYHVTSGGRRCTLHHVADSDWALRDGSDDEPPLELGSPEQIFDLAFRPQPGAEERLAAAAPHWPARLRDRLARRRVAGRGTVALDAGWFLEALGGAEPIPTPLLFPGGGAALGLSGLQAAAAVTRRTAVSLRAGRCDVADVAFAEVLLRAIRAERAAGGSSASGGDDVWGGAGRLVGEYVSGELAQIGDDVAAGCREAIGKGTLRVDFPAEEQRRCGTAAARPFSDSAPEPSCRRRSASRSARYSRPARRRAQPRLASVRRLARWRREALPTKPG